MWALGCGCWMELCAGCMVIVARLYSASIRPTTCLLSAKTANFVPLHNILSAGATGPLQRCYKLVYSSTHNHWKLHTCRHTHTQKKPSPSPAITQQINKSIILSHTQTSSQKVTNHHPRTSTPRSPAPFSAAETLHLLDFDPCPRSIRQKWCNVSHLVSSGLFYA